MHGFIGETGTGKTRAARMLWTCSGHSGRLVPVADRDGLDEALSDPETGGILLDEIGTHDPALRLRLRAFLHAEGADPAADRTPVLIVTSSWPLSRLVQDGRLEAGLARRIAPHCLSLPTVGERQEDMAALCSDWLGQDGTGCRLDEACLAWIGAQDWPGNFRQIRQLLYQAAQMEPDTVIPVSRLAALHRIGAGAECVSFQGLMARFLPSMLDLESGTQGTLHARVLAEVERPLFSLVLKATDGNQLRAAALLGLNRNTLRKRLQLLGIETGRSRS
ncbi:two component response regulator [Swaminathania salitolerans LMG 21291]|uniref:Sigma-54 factor interaction domain-containing protein n=1 Tax=Swaminathania salitolerans TaxID=182838 RepID=A0A511BQM7_9PROT|nr:two component response regulator [Swaminathania salitolerans LMG 21291]GEL02555.1 hypothetical protein SSA02_17180 [Swaminathania salitolerans]